MLTTKDVSTSQATCTAHFDFSALDCVWNVMAHAQKPDFVFRRNGRVHLNGRGHQFIVNTGSRGVRISGSNAGHTTFRGSVKSTGYPLHSLVSPSLPLPCVTVLHHISTGLYLHYTNPRKVSVTYLTSRMSSIGCFILFISKHFLWHFVITYA